jgi:hypothetical protein
VDAIVLDPRERARVRENPGHRRARNDQPSRGFLSQNRNRGNLSQRGEKKKRPIKIRFGIGHSGFEWLWKYRSKTVFAIKKGELFFFFSRLMYR